LGLLSDPERLGTRASRCELRIKATLGRLELPDDFAAGCAAAGLRDLPVTSEHADGLDMELLPHRDPFDAVLVAQAQAEGLVFLTADRSILKAGVGAVDARR